MPSLKSIRKRIGSVKSTQKITRAMKMVAGARLNRAQQRITALRPYAQKTQEILEGVTAALASGQEEGPADAEAIEVEKPVHKLLARRPIKKALFVVLSSDRGLCGGYNANVVKLVMREWDARKAEGVEVTFATAGKKAREAIVRKRGTIAKDFPKIYDGLDLEKAKLVADYATEAFLKGDVDAVYVLYTEFKSAMTQRPSVQQLLPLAKPTKKAEDKEGGAALTKYDYEPNEKALLSRLVPGFPDDTSVPPEGRTPTRAERSEPQAERSDRSVIERLPRPMATRPDCTSSRMPNGSMTFRKASSLSGLPVTSTVTASGATSTTLARNNRTVSSTLEREVMSALILTSSSSRCTEDVVSNSTILMTFTSLFSCLVTCSSGKPSTSTTIVIRETAGDSVGPTARLSML